MDLAPIVLFIYNRPLHTLKTLEALERNELAEQSVLYVFADGPKKNASQEDLESINAARLVCRNIKWCKEIHIIESETNQGLANSIINGVTQVVNKYGSIIVLEDDLIVSNYFLKFMNEALIKYESEETVISISAFSYPIKNLPSLFFLKGADCWGWATWKRGWDLFEYDGKKLLHELEKLKSTYSFNYNDSYPFKQMLKDQIDGKNSSWAIRWYASAFLKNKITLYPSLSFVNNVGFDGSGTHCDDKNHFETSLETRPKLFETIKIEENKEVKKKISIYLKKLNLPKLSKKDVIIKYIPTIMLKYYTRLFNKA